MPSELKISVVLPTYRGKNVLRSPLNSLLSQDFPWDDWELIIINNGKETDFTHKEVDMLADKFEYIPYSNYDECKVYNRGFDMCEGKLVIIMHDSSWLDGKDFLTRLWRISEEGRRMVGVRHILFDEFRPGVKVHDSVGFYGHNDAVPLEWLRKVGGFNEEFDGAISYKDIDLFLRLKQAGCPYIITPDLVSYKITKPSTKPSEGGDPQRNLALLSKKHGVTTYVFSAGETSG